MADWRILSRRAQDGHLVVDVEHFHVGGAHWFFEDYVFQGREGSKRKRVTNAEGKLLLDDDSEAPTILVDGEERPFLPQGREWKRETIPHLRWESIEATIRSIHTQRLISGWTTDDNRLKGRVLPSTQTDHDGTADLLAISGDWAGREA